MSTLLLDLETVFEHIRIEASPEQVRVAEELDLSCIRPYVRAVTMTPSKYSWTMTEDAFQHIVSTPRIEEICRQVVGKWYEAKSAGEDVSRLASSGSEEIEKLGWKDFVKKYPDSKTPFSERDMTIAYRRYMQHAERLREMFETKRLHRAWTRVLGQLPNARSFKIGMWKFDCSNHGPWRDLACDIRAHLHNFYVSGHEAEACRQLQEPIGEMLCKTVAVSLIAANSRIRQLEIGCTVDSKFIWTDDGTLDDLDLSRLETLSFHPIVADWKEIHIWSSERKATTASRFGLTLSTLLHKCSSSLQILVICLDHDGRPHYTEWPPAVPSHLPLLPDLTSFETGMRLDLPAFARFLLQSPALTFLRLKGCGGDLDKWRELWDAIRNHPSRMKLEFDQLPCNEATEWTAYHYTGEPSKAEFDDNPWENIDYSLENYLSGTRHWDRTLEMWFNGGDGEATDSEEDDSDYDDNSERDEAGSEFAEE